MQYAKVQFILPQREDDNIFGGTYRSILVARHDPERGHLFILHVNALSSSIIHADAKYLTSTVCAYPVDDEPDRHRVLEEGRMTRNRYAAISKKITEHLGVDFDVTFISRQHTLLLDAPGRLNTPMPSRGVIIPVKQMFTEEALAEALIVPTRSNRGQFRAEQPIKVVPIEASDDSPKNAQVCLPCAQDAQIETAKQELELAVNNLVEAKVTAVLRHLSQRMGVTSDAS
jgi:hypothetical protein